MFDLKRPCVNCPFRRSSGGAFALGRERLEEIASGPAFQCHKTVDYSGDETAPGDRPQQCAGLMAVLRAEGRENTIMQLAERLRHADFSDLDPGREAFSSWAQVLEAHCPS